MVEYYIERALKEDLDWMKKLVFGGHDEDMVIIIDGRERSGKSVLALQIAAYLDPSFDSKSVCFTTASFVKFIRDNEKRAVVFDESIVGLHASRSMERQTIFLDELLAQSGQKNLITILVVPFFFELTRRTAIGRSQFLIHVYRDASFTRGHYRVYDYKGKRKLYFLGKKLFEYHVKGVKVNYHGHFPNIYPIDEQDYRDKKREALNKFTKRFSDVMDVKTALRWVQIARLLEISWFHENNLLKRGAIGKRAKEGGGDNSFLAKQIESAKRDVEAFELHNIFTYKALKQRPSRGLGFGREASSFMGGQEGKSESSTEGGKE